MAVGAAEAVMALLATEVYTVVVIQVTQVLLVQEQQEVGL
jgi:hypothetical protein